MVDFFWHKLHWTPRSMLFFFSFKWGRAVADTPGKQSCSLKSAVYTAVLIRSGGLDVETGGQGYPSRHWKNGPGLHVVYSNCLGLNLSRLYQGILKCGVLLTITERGLWCPCTGFLRTR